MAVMYDYVLDELRLKDVVLVSLASGSVLPDPLIVNNLQVKATASINNLYLNNAYISTATIGNLTTNNISNHSTVSTNYLYANGISASTASIGFGTFDKVVSATATLGLTHISTIDWNLTSGATVTQEGQMNWDANQQTAVIGMAGGNVDLALGMEQLFPRRVRNSTGSTMAKGTVVYINGVSGNTPTVERAIATSDMSSAFTLGMTAEAIGNGATGWVTTFGELTGLDLSTYTGGDTLYLSGATAGAFTNVPQLAPKHYVRVGTVVKATTDGALVVNVINGYELNELHNVAITSLASGQIIQSGASNLWYNRSLASAVADLNVLASLGSLAYLNSVTQEYLPSTASFSTLNIGTITTKDLSVTSTASIRNLRATNLIASNVSISNSITTPNLFGLNFLGVASLISTDTLGANNISSVGISNTSNISTNTLYANIISGGTYLNLPSLGSLAPLNSITQEYLPSTASFNLLYTNGIANNSTVSTNRLNTNQILASTATIGNITSNNLAVTSNASVQLLNANYIGVGISNPVYPLSVSGVIYSNDQIQAGGQIFGNDISSTTTIDAGTNITAGGYIVATGVVLGSNLAGSNTGDQFMPVYGDGSDGFVTFDGSSTYTFASFDGSSTYTLTRDVFAYNIVVGAGITVITAGYRVFSQLYITNGGTIHNNGSAGSGTTGGAGGLGGFFKAGGAGATGLGTASAGAVGTAQATPTANTLVGGIGGKGAMGRAGTTTFTGGMITSANITVPADADGGNKVQSNYINYLTRYIVGATNWQMTPSIGGGSGAKSATGTTATSGGGGGGGGIVFLASPIIDGSGTISANGGAGGNASGTGGNFGGGGGGGGGIVCYIARDTSGLIATPTASGGAGGTSVIGTNGTLPVATAQGTTTTATQTMTITPTVPLTKGNLYLITFHLQITGGIGGSGINSMSGYGINWTNLNTRVEFNSIASPTRVIETWYGYYTGTEPDIIDDETITVNLSNLNTNARAIIDEIQNTDASLSINPVTANTATNRVDSATTLTVTLPTAPTAGNLVYSVFGRSAGTAPTAGAGNTIVNSQTTAPQLVSQVSSAQQANTQTHTTASAVAGISVEITKSTAGKNGANGWDGKVVRIYG